MSYADGAYPFDPCLEINAAGLEARLEHYQLMDKTPREMCRDDLCALAQAFADCLHGFTLPAWKNGALVIPRTAPAQYKSWLFEDNFTAAAKVLQSCGASEDQIAAALGPDWREILERRKNNGMSLKQLEQPK